MDAEARCDRMRHEIMLCAKANGQLLEATRAFDDFRLHGRKRIAVYARLREAQRAAMQAMTSADAQACNDSLEFIAMNNRLVSLLRQWCETVDDPWNLSTVRQMELRDVTEDLIGKFDGTFAGGPNAEGNYDPPV